MGKEKVCPNCGYNERKDISVNSNISDDKIFITIEEARKLELIKLGLSVLIVVLGLLLLFLPIFEISIDSFEDILNMNAEDFEALMQNEGELKFSYYNEAKLVFEQIFEKDSSVNLHDVLFSSLVVFLALIILFVVWIIVGCIGIIKSIIALLDIKKTRIAYFMRAEKYPKESMLDLRSHIDVVLFVIFVSVDSYMAFGSDIVYRKLVPMGLFDFSNFSLLFIPIIIIAVAFFVFKFWAEKFDVIVRKNISQRRKAKKEENKKENEEAHQRNVKQKEIQQTTKKSENQSASVAEEIKKYAVLLEEGIITQEEFDQKKKELLRL